MLELLAQRLQAFATAGSEEAEVAYLNEAFGEDVLQEAVDEGWAAATHSGDPTRVQTETPCVCRLQLDQ